jgi:prepilin-type N-terminal cleavage/methylation domain-containing protein/prepilin-type processing-associated H-X9-DG protein
MNKRGFTLIELLVVIAIIALLLSIIVPSLSKVKVLVEEVMCRSNIRQYGLAGKMYLDDYKAKFPNAWNSIYKSTDPDRQCQFHDVLKHPDRRPELAGSLWNYIGSGKVHYCQTFARFMKTGEPHPGHVATIPIEPLFCYSMNAFLGGFEGGTHRLRVAVSDIRSPSRIFFFAEENGWSYTPVGGDAGSVRYSATLNDNALCGSSEHPSYATAWTKPLDANLKLVGANVTYLDAFGSYHKTTIQKRNSGMANAVFVDGHVGLVDPQKTYYHTNWTNKQPPLY